MHDQGRYPQVGKLRGQRTALRKVIGIVAEELIDLEIDVQVGDKQLSGQLSCMPAVRNVRGPGELAVGPLDLVIVGPPALWRGVLAGRQVGAGPQN